MISFDDYRYMNLSSYNKPDQTVLNEKLQIKTIFRDSKIKKFFNI